MGAIYFFFEKNSIFWFNFFFIGGFLVIFLTNIFYNWLDTRIDDRNYDYTMIPKREYELLFKKGIYPRPNLKPVTKLIYVSWSWFFNHIYQSYWGRLWLIFVLLIFPFHFIWNFDINLLCRTSWLIKGWLLFPPFIVYIFYKFGQIDKSQSFESVIYHWPHQTFEQKVAIMKEQGRSWYKKQKLQKRLKKEKRRRRARRVYTKLWNMYTKKTPLQWL